MNARSLSVLMLASLISGCADSCREYSDFSCKEIERAPYNVHFSYPSGDLKHLGKVSGLAACGRTAYSYANSKGLTPGDGWGYVCCMRAKGSECYEKHR